MRRCGLVWWLRLWPTSVAATVPFARRLHEVAPDRCVWGSDWPHVAHWGAMMNVGELLDLLADWVPDEAARNRVFVENAHRLYGFGFGAGFEESQSGFRRLERRPRVASATNRSRERRIAPGQEVSPFPAIRTATVQ